MRSQPRPHTCPGVILLALAAHVSTNAEAANHAHEAQQILGAAGTRGGLVVHLGCGDGRLTTALCVNDSYLVHGLSTDRASVEKARRHLADRDMAEQAMVAWFDGTRLPYRDNTVNLVVAEDRGDVSMAEITRVLAPEGVALVKRDWRSYKTWWTKTVKPRPTGIDEWTHGLHGPDNNAVAHDTVVGSPRHLQWVGGPRWARSHDHLASVSAVVSSGGRIFTIVDEGPTAAVALPAQWRLVARDAYNGVILWKRDVSPWEGHLRGFRTGPAAIMRRLVAIGNTVYVTLGYGKPVTALDAATGETIRTYSGTEDTLEILCAEGVLYLAIGPTLSDGAAASTHQTGPFVSPEGKRLARVYKLSGEKAVWVGEHRGSRTGCSMT